MEKNAIQRLNTLIKEKNSRICAGLDPTWDGIPKAFKEKAARASGAKANLSDEELKDYWLDEIFIKYCREYIDAICDIVPAIKINSAFFEKVGKEETYWGIAEYAKLKGLFVIGDVKRADIGSTSKAYSEAFLKESSPFDAITINPYFGTDGVMPFFELAKENGKGVFVLVKTSNKSSAEVQDLKLRDGRYVYEAVADLVLKWGREVEREKFPESKEKRPIEYPLVGAVIGATQPEQVKRLTKRMGVTFVLIPEYGEQGGKAKDIACNFDCQGGIGAIVNSSRGIMQAYKKEYWKDKYSEETWEKAAREEAIRATNEINQAINKFYGLNIC